MSRGLLSCAEQQEYHRDNLNFAEPSAVDLRITELGN